MKMQTVKNLICKNLNRIETTQMSIKDKVSLYEDVLLLNFYLESKLDKYNKCTKLSNPLLWRVK